MGNQGPLDLQQLSQKYRSTILDRTEIRREEETEYYAPSFGQQRLWFLAQLPGGSEAYNMSVGWVLKGSLDESALSSALNEIVQRHESLRTTFKMRRGKLIQHVTDRQVCALRKITFLGSDPGRPDVRAIVTREVSERFDLENGPLIRGTLLQMNRDEHIFIIVMHHLVSDGRSEEILIGELQKLYDAKCEAGIGAALPQLPIQYADYARWQIEQLSRDRLVGQREYWRRQLKGALSLLNLLRANPRPIRQDFRGDRVSVEFDQELLLRLRALSQTQGVTLFVTILTAWALVLSRLSAQGEVVIGVPSANRSRPEIVNLIGFFVNTLALRIGVSGSSTTAELLELVRNVVLEAHAHQDLPFEQVVDLVKPNRDLNHTPLFQVMFAWQSNKTSLRLHGLQVYQLENPAPTAKCDMSLELGEVDGRIVGSLNYATALFNFETAKRYVDYLRTTLRAMATGIENVAMALPLLSDEERKKLLVDWNTPEASDPRDHCIHQLFETHAGANPTRAAVFYEGQCITYGELNARAGRLASYLIGLGVCPESRVALCMERSLETVVGLIAILKAGAAYVPMDPSLPAERLAYILEDTLACVVLTRETTSSNFSAALALHRQAAQHCTLSVLELGASDGNFESYSDCNLDSETTGVTPDNLAYIIYTSGSTGQPKGVMVEHRNLVATLSAVTKDLEISRDDVFSALASPGFDISLFELLLPLVNGAAISLVRETLALNLEYLATQLANVTIFHATPSLMKVWLDHHGIEEIKRRYRKLRRLLVGGEPVSPTLIERLSQIEGVQATELYGPTEATIVSTYYEVPLLLSKSSGYCIGRPFGHARIYLLDRLGNPVPEGVPGEIYIGGGGVGRGYLNKAALTEERFVESSFVKGDRLYRTGDLGRYLQDGNVEFLGRNDFQIKIRGFRIELGEVEARLTSHPLINESVVLVREDHAEDKHLVAYYTLPLHRAEEESVEGDSNEPGRAMAGAIQPLSLRAHLASSLPDYMIPAAYVLLKEFPLTATGKIDRKALPQPDDEAYGRKRYESPVGPVEIAIAQIWSEILGVDHIGRSDNFFELGGHSLLAITALEEMRRIGLGGDVLALFTYPVLQVLATQVTNLSVGVDVPPNRIGAGCAYITPELVPLVSLTQDEINTIVSSVPGGTKNVQDIYSLAPLQEGILVHHLMAPHGDPYVLRNLFSFPDEWTLEKYVSALNKVIDRHDILRTAIIWEGVSQPVQVVWRQAAVSLKKIKIDGTPDSITKQLMRDFDPQHHRIDISVAPLIRLFAVYAESIGQWFVLQLTHHLCADHTTLELLRSEIRAQMADQVSSLPAPVPFRNFIAQAKLGASRQEHEAFFEEMLGDVSESTAPFGLLGVRRNGSDVDQESFKLDDSLAGKLHATAKVLGVSVASICHVAWGLVIGRSSNRQDPVFGTVLFGRMHGELGVNRALGLFINTLPIRIKLEDVSVTQCVVRTHRLLAQLLRHEHASLTLAQRCSGVTPPTPLFTTVLNYRHSVREMESSNVDDCYFHGIRPLASDERTNYPITLSVDDFGGDFRLVAQAASPINPMRVCLMMSRALETLVDALEFRPNHPAERLDVVPVNERKKLLTEWNRTDVDFPHHLCVHHIFESTVEANPAAVAVTFDGQSLTYAELNIKANRLAHHLMDLGAHSDRAVAICMERSLEMVIAVVATLKAGAAYVPLDPDYPPGRLSYMLNDCAPDVVLTHSATLASSTAALELSKAFGRVFQVLDVQNDEHQWTHRPITNTDPAGLSSRSLAYIMYTSGSTGQPKGVMIEHEGVVNRLLWMQKNYDISADDSILQKTPFSFDVSVWEFFLTLMAGAKLVMALPRAHKDAHYLERCINEAGITVIHFVPSMLGAFVREHVRCPSLKKIFCSGEELPTRLIGRVEELFPFAELHNLYGPTEASIDVTYWRCVASEGALSAPIGRPISNTRIYLLDRSMNLVPEGVAGEIYIGGVGVARGYLNQPELTRQRFIQNPFVDANRLYKTGDLGRHLPDGNIEFLGRNDFQVKLRGFRIEPGEIEAQLLSHSQVLECAVLVRENRVNEQQLVAYYTLASDFDPGPLVLHKYLSSFLPEYMVPATYVCLQALPLTVSGKLDRNALPAPKNDGYNRQIYEAPLEAVEIALSQIWSEVLPEKRISRHDNFFELGGHSLLAIRVLDLIRRRLGVELPMNLLYEDSLAELASVVLCFPTTIFNSDPGTSIIRVRAGAGIPVVLVHALGGGISDYKDLVASLKGPNPIYGLHAYAPESSSANTVGAIGSIYASHIARIQMQEPVCIVGYSFGAMIADAIARKLIEMNHTVSTLVLFDFPFPELITSKQSSRELWFNFAKMILGSAKYSKVKGNLASGGKKFIGLLEALREDSKHEFSMNYLRNVYKTYRRHIRARDTFVPPTTPYSGPVIFYRSTLERQVEALRHYEQRWSRVEIIDVQADHDAIVRSPAADAIGLDLTSRFKQDSQIRH